MRVRWKRHAGWIAVALGVLSLALLAVVGFQAWMLRSQGWRIVLGALPDWVTAVLTGVTAFGVLAAFGTLRIGRKEWETHQKERRDQQANQARLIIVEALKRADMVPPANTAAVMPDGRPEYRYVVIRNHSQEPVFNVQIADGAYDEAKTNMPWITSTAEVRVQEEDGSSYSPTPTLVFRHTPELIPVLAPGQATYQLYLDSVPRDKQVTEYVYFTFTDARGTPWARFGSQQPVPEGHYERSGLLPKPVGG